ncbi:hypothetical protein [Brevifollis gellanilyticus]|uniref:Uncharacterized protein n=1 Tax=Brevifollis gellanilyticus TaxID=748831 RepID=A0A512MD88_9BACT|nr:hypothetical protein [Brevifollis gellanilyticus]GEP44696.1 hypothetical protein BGE01nite_39870 [Brevifollis gellanilyticus]
MRRLPFLFSSLLCLATVLQAQDEPLSLRLRWLPEHTYTQETTTETTSGIKITGKGEEQKMKVKQTTEIKVTGAGTGEKLARVTFVNLSGEVMLNGKKETFDSANLKDANPMIQSSVGKSVGKTFVLAYGADDQFLEVRNSSSMAETPDDGPNLVRIAEAKQVADLYRRSLEMGLPKGAVKPGDRWTAQETVNFPSAGTMNIELRAKLESVVSYEGRQHAKVTFEGEMKRTEETAGSRAVTIGDGSRVFGQVLFDVERGTVTFGAFLADIQLEISGKKIPVRQQVTTKLVGFTKA